MNLPHIPRDWMSDDMLDRARGALLAATCQLTHQSMHFAEHDATEAERETRLNEDALGRLLGLVLSTQKERRADNAESPENRDREEARPNVVGLRGWREDARFVVTNNDLQSGIVTLRLVDRDTGALSPFPQEAHTDNVIWDVTS